DPFWGHEKVACFVSDAASTMGQMSLWVAMPGAEKLYQAASDGGDQGPIEHVSLDSSATYCVYTVLAAGGVSSGGTTYIGLRNLDTGATTPLIEGPGGAYDAAISPDGAW